MTKENGKILSLHAHQIIPLLLFVMICLISPAVGEGAGSEPAGEEAAGNSITLTWDAPRTNTDGTPLNDLAGYNIYYWTHTDDWPNSRYKKKLFVVPLIIHVALGDTRLICTQTEITARGMDTSECRVTIKDSMLQGFKRGREYYFAITAYNRFGIESNHSQQVMKKID